MSFRIVIPARYASTRLPAKALADIAGKPMIVRVAEAVRAADGDHTELWVATDHADIVNAVEQYGFRAILTRSDHDSGTDRIAEVAERLAWGEQDIVINVQGDEPLIEAALLAKVAAALHEDTGAAIATASHPIVDTADLFNPNVVKVVCANNGRALYFSRAPIPWNRDGFTRSLTEFHGALLARRHIGLYAYRVGFLRQYGRLAASPLESCEALEQLRALWHGFAIHVVNCDHAPAAGVDTQEDLDRVRREFDHRGD